MKYRPEIDGLRALAVLPVILFHAGFDFFSGGFIGVDIFFVISGYLITTILLNDFSQNNFSFLNFYERRARRLLPAIFFVMLVCLPFAWFLMIPSDLKDFGRSLFAVPLYISNFLFWYESGYFDGSSDYKPLLHTWSLAVEEQYYIIAPLVLVLTWKLGIRNITILLSTGLILSLAISELGYRKIPVGNFYMLFSRAWEIMIGALVSIYLREKSFPKSVDFSQIFSILGLGLVIFSILFFNESTPTPSLYTLLPTLGTALIIIFSVPGTFMHQILSKKFIVHLGLISYSAYLWHNPVLVFARHYFIEDLSNFFLIFLCLISLFFAHLSWKYIESPFRDKKQTSRKLIFKMTVTGTIFFCSIGLITSFNDGFHSRIKGNIDPKTAWASELRSKCDSASIPCEYFKDEVTWASVGDSHMIEMTYALAEKLAQKNIGIQHNTNAGCKPELNNPKSQCSNWIEKVIKDLNQNEKIENVVISFRLTKYIYGEYIDNYPTLVDETTSKQKEKIFNDLSDIFNSLIKSGKKIYFIVQPPELPLPASKLIFWNKEDNFIKGVQRSWWLERRKYISQNLEIFSDKVEIIDPIDLFCDEDYCYINDESGYFYFDDHHLSIYGANKVVERYIFKNSKKQ